MKAFEKSISIDEKGNISYDIQKLLEMIRKRPGIFIGSMDLRDLKVYIEGFKIAIFQLKAKNTNKKDFHDFHEFVRAKYGYFESTAGWANMIINYIEFKDTQNLNWEKILNLESKKTGREHIDIFYELIDEFYT